MAGRLMLGQILVAKGLVHPDQVAAALSAQQERGGRLGMLLLEMGAITEEDLIRALARQLGVKIARTGGKTVSAEVLSLVPSSLAEKHRCLPLFLRDGETGEELVLAMEDPSDDDALEELRRHVSCALFPVLIPPSELVASLERYYSSAEEPDPEITGATLMAVPLAPLPQGAPALAQGPEPVPPPEADLGLPPIEGFEDPGLAETAPDEGEDPVLGTTGLGDSQVAPAQDPLGDSPVAPAQDPLGDSLASASLATDSALGDSLMELAPPPLCDPEASWSSPADDPGLEDPAFVGGDPFSEFEKEPFADAAVAGPAEEPTDPVAGAGSAPASDASRMEGEVILQALAQLLVEKGVITREEFAQRLKSLARRPG